MHDAALAAAVVAGEEDPEGLVEEVKKALTELVDKAKREMLANKRKSVGAARVLRQKYWHKPKTREPRRRLMPTFAAKSTELRVRLAIEQLEFDAAYDVARSRWLRTGKATFPYGTCKMKGFPGVRVREAPTAA